MDPRLIHHLIGYGLIAGVYGGLGIVVLGNNFRSQVHRAFGFCLLSIGWWGAFAMPAIVARDPTMGMLWVRLYKTGTILIPVLFLRFVLIYTGRPAAMRFLRWSNWLLSGFFLLTLWGSSQLIAGVQTIEGMRCFTYPGPLYFYFILFFFFNSTLAVLLLADHFQRNAEPAKRKQIMTLFLFSMLGFFSGSFIFLLAYGIRVPFLTYFSYYGITIFGLSTAFIIYRYRFLDIRLTSYEKERLKSLLAVTGSVHHEIRNPLGFMVEDIHNLREACSAIQDESVRQRIEELAEGVEKRAARVADVTRAIGRYARPVKDSVDFRPVKVPVLVREEVTEFQTRAGGEALKLVLDMDEGTPQAFGDEVFIRESLRNFLSNAAGAIRKAGRREGRIDIRVRQSGGDRVSIEVKDNGCGIAEADRERIFELGYTTRSGDGLRHGAGLFLVKWYADQMKAELKLESVESQETRITLILPQAKERK